jgi:methionyl-tRNA synthetase
MHISPDQCVQCGSRARPTFNAEYLNLGRDGSFRESPCWFCSVECYKTAIRKYIKDKTYDFDNGPEDDREFVAQEQSIGLHPVPKTPS